MQLHAHAKINWDLRILGRRSDGFHEIDTLMATVGLADRLLIEPAESLSLTCSDPGLPCDERNLVVQAARALAAAAQVPARARIHLEKEIPAGGGLGGGSSDAAATLRGLNAFWGIGWPRERLATLAAALGSDVAYFLWGGWCRCRGRGEVVEPLPEGPALPSLRLLLLLPPLMVPTPAVYKALAAPAWDGKSGTRSLAEAGEKVRRAAAELSAGKAFAGWPDNALRQPACAAEPKLVELQRVLSACFPGRWQLSGSGAAHVLAPLADETVAGIATQLEAALASGVQVLETRTLSAAHP